MPYRKRIKVTAGLEDEADIATMRWQAMEIHTIDANGSCVIGLNSSNHSQQGRFAAAAGPQENHAFPEFHVQRKMAQHRAIAVRLRNRFDLQPGHAQCSSISSRVVYSGYAMILAK